MRVGQVAVCSSERELTQHHRYVGDVEHTLQLRLWRYVGVVVEVEHVDQSAHGLPHCSHVDGMPRRQACARFLAQQLPAGTRRQSDVLPAHSENQMMLVISPDDHFCDIEIPI